MALGLLGGWWLALAEPLSGRVLLLGADGRPPDTARWAADASLAADRVLAPAATSGALAVGLLWAAAAAVLPLLVRGRSTGADLLAGAAWAGALAAGTAVVARELGGPEPGGLAASTLVAVALAAAGARVGPGASSHTHPMQGEAQGSARAPRGRP